MTSGIGVVRGASGLLLTLGQQSACRLLGMALLATAMTTGSPESAQASEIVNIAVEWPTVEGNCSPATTKFFSVQGPAYVDIYLEVDPYRSAGRIGWLTDYWGHLNNKGEVIGDWSLGPGLKTMMARNLQGGKVVRNFTEGVALINESKLHYFENRVYRQVVRLVPPCDTSSNLARKDQAYQRATLVVRYGSGGPGDTTQAGFGGVWAINANGTGGTIEFNPVNGGWEGQWDGEKLSDISFDPASGRVSFTRPGVSQRFTGRLTPDGFSGSFDQDGAGDYSWTAQRPGATPEGYLDTPGTVVEVINGDGGDVVPVDDGILPNGHLEALEGSWRITANGYPGTIEFTLAGNGWSGRENIDGAWEPLSDIVFEKLSGRVEFSRPRVAQRYKGVLGAGGIAGTFDQGGAGQYAWSAAR